MPGGDRFSHARGLHYQGTGDTLRSVLHRYRQPRREDRGYHSPSRQPVDDADRAESRRPERRLPSWQSLCDTLPVYEILGRIAQRSRPRRHSSRSLAGTIAQFECFRRAVRAFNKRGVFKPNDLLRTGIASARSPAVHGALSYRAQSSGPGKPTSAARIRHCPTPSPCSTPTAPRRNAQLLPSGRSLTKVDSLFLDNAAKVAGGISAASISIVISSRPQIAMKGSGTMLRLEKRSRTRSRTPAYFRGCCDRLHIGAASPSEPSQSASETVRVLVHLGILRLTDVRGRD